MTPLTANVFGWATYISLTRVLGKFEVADFSSKLKQQIQCSVAIADETINLLDASEVQQRVVAPFVIALKERIGAKAISRKLESEIPPCHYYGASMIDTLLIRASEDFGPELGKEFDYRISVWYCPLTEDFLYVADLEVAI